MRSPSLHLAHDDGRPGREPALIRGSPSLLGLRAAEVTPAHGMVALGLAGLCAFLSMFATQPLLPLLGAAFGVSKAEAALTVSAPAIAVALAAPFAGALADRLGRRRVIVGSLFTLAVPTLLAATAETAAALAAWRFLQGLGVAGVYAVGISYAGASWRGGDVGRAAAALVTGNVLGGFLGRVLSGVAAELAGWRAAFVVLGLLTVVGAELTRRWLPRGEAAPAGSSGRALRALPAQLKDPRLASTFAAGFNVLFAQVALFTYVTFHLAAPPFGLGTGALAAIFTVYLLGAAVTPVAGAWIGRIGPRRTLALALLAALAGCALALAPSVAGVVAGLALCSSAVFVAQAAATSHLNEVTPPHLRSVAAGAYLSCYYLGGAAGGILPAAAWHLGGWRACVALTAAVHLATLALGWRFWQREPEAPAERVALA
jgi:predicted MFS family arabinose efflux permease